MSVTAFNRRRRELKKKLEEAEKEKLEKEIQEEVKNEDVEEETPFDLNKLKVDELKSIAKEKGLEGYSSMTKAELIQLIEKA